jgi:thioredoxin 1
MSSFKELTNSDTPVLIDVDKNKALATKFSIRGVPAFLIFKNGKQVWKGAGVQPLHELKAQIEKA